MEFLALGLRLVLALVFLFAGLSKLPRLREFEQAVHRYDLLPPAAVQWVAVGLPPAEIVCGLLLFAGLETTIVAALLGALLSVFAVAVIVNLLRGREIDCGCFSLITPKRIGWPAVIRNLALAAAAGIVVVRAPRTLAVDGFVSGGADASTTQGIGVLIAATTALASYSLGAEALRLRRLARAVVE